MNKNYLKTSQFYPITTVCLISFLICFVSVKLSVFLGIFIAFWLMMRAKPDGILGLFLLYFVRYYFYYVESFVTPTGTVAHDLRQVLTLAGFPLEVETLACIFVSIRVVVEWLFYPETYHSKFPGILFPLWLLAFIPVIIGIFINYGAFNWTGGIRYLMVTGSYFYGYILVKNWPKGENNIFIPMFAPFIFIMLSLMNASFFWSHHGFLFLGFGAAFSVYYMRKTTFKYRFLGVIFFALSVGYALRGSLTMMLIVVLTLFFSYLGIRKRKERKGFRSYFTWFAGNIAILSIFLFTAYACYHGFESDYDPTVMYGSYTGSTMERIEAKILSDRLPLWLSALNQILSGDSLLIPRIKPLVVVGFPDGWWAGSHNTILDSLRINGLFSGTIMLVILYFALKNNLKVLEKSQDQVLKILAAGILGVGIASIPLNIIPIDMTMGFWWLSMAGLCHGLFLRDTSEAVPVIEQSKTSEYELKP